MEPYLDIQEEINVFLLKMSQFWNAQDLEAFVQCYHHAEGTSLIAQGKIIFGWNAIHSLYQSLLGQSENAGQLTTETTFINVSSKQDAVACTKWTLKARDKVISGYATVQLKKIDGAWYVTHDHSSY